jgi:exodeoxyribonuclease V beta subunit
MSFDDLISEMLRVVEDPIIGPSVRAALRSKYKLVMIDEFQDTDALQWRIFDRAFFGEMDQPDPSALALVMVGDPKQAIYRFRGADIEAYLTAVRSPRLVRRQMSNNFRTDSALIGVMNGLLGDFAFGDKAISYVQVKSKAKCPPNALMGGGNTFQIRWLPKHDELLSAKGNLTGPIADPLIAVDLANHVVQLLEEGQITEKPDKDPRRVRPNDICILVRSHAHAEPLIAELRRRGVAVVQTKVGSVLDSEARVQIHSLLSAMVHQQNAKRVAALTTTWFSSKSWLGLTDKDRADLQEMALEWSNQLAQLGIFAFFQKLRQIPDVLMQISAGGDLDRKMTDLEHVVELLHTATSGKPMSASAYMIILNRMVSEGGDSESLKRRVETDLEAVQITTIHSSKGLEYPIVLIPYPTAPRNDKPYVYSVSGQRYVDVAMGLSWSDGQTNAEGRKSLSEQENAGDDLRLLYVAFTRAKYQLVVWWADTQNSSDTALSKVLFRSDKTDAGNDKSKKDNQEIRSWFSRICSDLGNSALVELPPVIEDDRRVTTGQRTSSSLDKDVLTRQELSRWRWRRWSYSSIKDDSIPHESYEIRGGKDESSRTTKDDDDSLSHGMRGKLLALPKGADFGKYIHELMEHVDFASPDLRGSILASIHRQPSGKFTTLDKDDLIDGLVAAIETPIDEIAEDYSLRKIKPSEQLAEMNFFFNILNPGVRLLGSIASLASKDSNKVFEQYFESLVESAGNKSFDGLMTGSIDGLYRLSGVWGEKFVVVDYKTNALHSASGTPEEIVASYGFDSMKSEMELHDYPLQALVYSVALHRFLELRLPNYDPEKHLGGSGYLFLRGMTGVDTPVVDGKRNGVFAWRPSAETVLKVSELFNGL